MQIKSLPKDKILVEIMPLENKTESGIILVSGDGNDKFKGTVLMVGPLVDFIKVGNVVKYYEHVGTEVEHDGKNCIILREKSEVIAVL